MNSIIDQVRSEEPIWVRNASGDYPIYVGFRLLENETVFQDIVLPKKVFILSHANIASHYLSSLIQRCIDAGASQIDHYLIPSGDQYKTLQTAEKIWDQLITLNHHRDTLMIALGGGMVGDLAGFCAACYLRGVKIIQCPTSLLAQIDAAIGGKTGINHEHGKNMIGAFHQPHAVVIDLNTLQTLPRREFISGLAELIKYGIALDANLFAWLEENIAFILEYEKRRLYQSVRWACLLKARIVSLDEKEKGCRIVLNFGHTVAHAIESLLNYQLWLHGEAVAIGMIIATDLSYELGLIEVSLRDRLIRLIQKTGLPTQLPKGIAATAILAKITKDKKHTDQKLQWVLLKDLGEATISTAVTSEQIKAILIRYGAV